MNYEAKSIEGYIKYKLSRIVHTFSGNTRGHEFFPLLVLNLFRDILVICPQNIFFSKRKPETIISPQNTEMHISKWCLKLKYYLRNVSKLFGKQLWSWWNYEKIGLIGCQKLFFTHYTNNLMLNIYCEIAQTKPSPKARNC